MNNINTVQGLINQQLGISTWKPFDIVLKRINSAAIMRDMFIESHIFTSRFAEKQGYQHVLALGDENGGMSIIDTQDMTHFNSKLHVAAITDIAWLFKETKIITTSGCHSAKLIDISDEGIRELRLFLGHPRAVYAVAIKPNDDSIFATGGADGNIVLWDTRSRHFCDCIVEAKKLIHCAHGLKSYSSPHIIPASTVTGLAFQDENALISCSASDGIIKIWDLRKTYNITEREPVPRNTIPCFMDTCKYGFSNLIVDKISGRLYASCLNNLIYCFDILTYNPQPMMRYVGSHMDKFYHKACLSNDGMYLLRGSQNKCALIWNTQSSRAVSTIKVQTDEVTSVAWSQSVDTILATCLDDLTFQIWQVRPFPENWTDMGDLEEQKESPN